MKTPIIFFKYIIIGISMFLVVFSCAPKISSTKVTPQNKPIFYPKYADTARIQFLRAFSKSTDITPKQSAFKASILGEEMVFEIGKPYGISMAKGKIYICDLNSNKIVILDIENKTFNSIQPTLKKGFAQAINMFVDSEGFIYLANPLQRVISVYDVNFNYITEFGKKVNFRPVDVAVTNDKIYVVDIQNNRVNIFDKTTKAFLSYFPNSVVGNDDWLYSASAISISNNNIYITDTGDYSLKIYSLKGEFIKKMGNIGDGLGQFSRPKGNAVDQDDNVYVLDAAFENAQLFNKNGQLLMFFGGPYKGPGDMYLPAQITIDYDNIHYFEHLVDKRYKLLYLILVTNQYGPDKVSVYGRIELKEQ
ncbi:6-bladed beta-propeller [Aestuariivivens marinum]|uniref:6-bladed beta-propeller n=1 Tax=Aestuariivivens marinum TaxID=2913555 RepID=UPI001F59538D|nr:6-bladed beta-propeller [Aestuariivivens marinum]